jgi:hypothetical protein
MIAALTETLPDCLHLNAWRHQDMVDLEGAADMGSLSGWSGVWSILTVPLSPAGCGPRRPEPGQDITVAAAERASGAATPWGCMGMSGGLRI